MPDLLARLEAYYDAVPRAASRPEPVGPFTLFVPTGSWAYYGRPRLHLEDDVTADDVRALLARQDELRLPLSIEWLPAITPSLAAASTAAGLDVGTHPLLVLEAPRPGHAPDGVSLRLVEADDPGLPRVQATVALGFSTAGTAVDAPGSDERDALVGAQDVAFLRDRLRAGATRLVVAEDTRGPLAAGSHQPVDDVTELTGIATLPSARRRGIGTAVSAALVADARAGGVRTVFLSADDDAVARVYERVGFRRVGSACIAAPPVTA